METDKLISVIVPVYNVEDYVEKCIRSIMVQTYPLLEIIIVNDGSSDGSGSICDKLEAEDARIKVLHQRNEGLVRARKNGLNIAKGELIGFVDGDDYVEPVLYERLHKLLMEHEADFVHSGFFYGNIQEVKGVKRGGDICITEENRVEMIKNVVLGNSNVHAFTPSIWSKLFKRDLVIKSYSTIADSSSFGEDLLCLCNCFMICNKVFATREAYYHYTIRENSLSHDQNVTIMKRMSGLHNALQEVFIGYGVWDYLKEYVDEHYIRGLMEILTKRKNGSLERNVQMYQFPNIEQMFGQRIILYGAGSVGCDYYTQIRKYVKCELIAWTDRYYEKYKCDYCELIDPRRIPYLVYDKVLIGVMDEKSAEEIKHSLMRMGVPKSKIYWKCPERIKV